MTTKILYLHIGRHKSGTSSLQEYLTHYRADLATMGLCYPVTGTDGHVAHHSIASVCHQKSSSQNSMQAQFQLECLPSQKIIVSSEAFQNITNDSRLREFFGRSPAQSAWSRALYRNKSTTASAYDIHTICYLRELLEYASSSYAQRVQNAVYAGTFSDYCQSHFGKLSLIRFSKFWQNFSDVTTFRLFEREKLAGKDIVVDFFEVIGLPLPGALIPAEANPSISGNLLGFKLLVNSLGLHQRKMYGALGNLAQAHSRFRGRFAIPDDQASVLRQRYARYNKDLRQLVGDFQTRSFNSGLVVGDETTWREDLEIILAHPEFSDLSGCAKVAHARASDIQRLFLS